MDLYGSMVSRSLCVCISKVRWFCFPFGMLSWAPRWWWMRRTNPSLRVVGASHFRRGVVDFLSLVPCGFLKTEVKMMRITRRSWKRGNGLSSGWVFSCGCQLWEVFFFPEGVFLDEFGSPLLGKARLPKKGTHSSLYIHHYSQLETLGWTLQTLPGNGMVDPIETQHPTRSHGSSVGSGPWRLNFGALSSQSCGFLPKCISTSSSKSVISKRMLIHSPFFPSQTSRRHPKLHSSVVSTGSSDPDPKAL